MQKTWVWSLDQEDLGLIPGSPGEGNGNPLQCSCLENPLVRGAWRVPVPGVRVGRDWALRSRVQSWMLPFVSLYEPCISPLTEYLRSASHCSKCFTNVNTFVTAVKILCEKKPQSFPPSQGDISHFSLVFLCFYSSHKTLCFWHFCSPHVFRFPPHRAGLCGPSWGSYRLTGF